MSRRGALATIVVALWVVGLGVLVRKEYFRPHFERLAIAALRVNPGAVYFGILSDSGPLGFASSVVDTAKTEITITDNLVVDDQPVIGRWQRSVSRTTIVLSRGLRMRRFDISTEANAPPVLTTGVLEGDSVIVVQVTVGTNRPETRRVALTGPVLLPSLIPLALTLEARPKVGKVYTLPVFDPVGLAVREAKVAVGAESLFVLHDSAAFDPASKQWRAAFPDTVRAWRITPVSGTSFSAWIDAEGQIVETKRLGWFLRRLPYEVAFNNWKAASERRMPTRGTP